MQLPRVRLPLVGLPGGKYINTQGKDKVAKGKFNKSKDKVIQDKLTWADINTRLAFVWLPGLNLTSV